MNRVTLPCSGPAAAAETGFGVRQQRDGHTVEVNSGVIRRRRRRGAMRTWRKEKN
jgi:hypothetical protein